MGLTIIDLSCIRGGRRVLHGVGATWPDGTIVALRGPNGTGKSTLLRVLAGLLPATGTMTLDDTPLDSDRRSETVAYAGHLDALRPTLTVAETLAFWAALLGAASADMALAAFGLDAIADRPVALCSAGQRRRLALSRLLLAPRRLWLLDEPSAALDRDGESRLNALLTEHAARGGIAVVAAHGPLSAATQDLVLARPDAPAATDPFLTGTWA